MSRTTSIVIDELNKTQFFMKNDIYEISIKIKGTDKEVYKYFDERFFMQSGDEIKEKLQDMKETLKLREE